MDDSYSPIKTPEQTLDLNYCINLGIKLNKMFYNIFCQRNILMQGT